jgi:UDP:flavonoid glycosyltransferase YjiC (YdhE family)
MKLLFCSFDSPGYLFPLIGLALELQERGHQLAFAVEANALQTLVGVGIDRIPRGVTDGPSFRVNVHHQPLSIAVDVKHLEHAVERFAPDILVTHQLAHAPLLVRERTGIPVAVMGLFSYLWSWSPDAGILTGTSGLERTRQWRIGSDVAIVNEARALFRLPVLTVDGPDLPFLGDLFMLRTIEEFSPELAQLPPQVHAVGACLWEPPREDEKEWHALRAQFGAPDAPLLYVQHGRTFRGPGFWTELKEALADQPVQVVASVGRMDQDVGAVPANFVALDHVPQGLVLPHASAVISGGHTTAVLGALTHALPSILIPGGGETQDNAEKVVNAGCGVRLEGEALTTQAIRAAVDGVLAGAQPSRMGRRVQQAFARTAPFQNAAELVEQLANTRTRIDRHCKAALTEVEVMAGT